jgi:hypothetical protein
VPIAIELTGQDYNHTAVDERFTAYDGMARWHSPAESGESKSGGWYVAVDGPATQMAWLASGMIAAGKTTMPLLPGGQATLERGPSLAYKGEHLTMYSIGGMDFTPDAVWLDGHNALFASVGGFSTVRGGFEDALTKLADAEAKESAKRFHELAVRLGRKPSGALAIRHVRTFDSENAVVREDQMVVVKGRRIVSAGMDPGGAPAGAEVIDGTGQTLLPGLFDMHAHFSDDQGLLNIACGVTTVRDLGNNMDRLLRWKREMDVGEIIGPRVVLAGVMDGRGPFAGPTDVLVNTEEEARAAIPEVQSRRVYPDQDLQFDSASARALYRAAGA